MKNLAALANAVYEAVAHTNKLLVKSEGRRV